MAYDVRVATDPTTRVTSADYGLIQTSTGRARGSAVQWREPFEAGITHNQMWYFHGSSDWTELHTSTQLRPKKDKPRDRDHYGGHRGNRDNDRRGNDGGIRGIFTLRTEAQVRLVAPTLSLTCHAIAESLMSTAPTDNALSPRPLHPYGNYYLYTYDDTQ